MIFWKQLKSTQNNFKSEEASDSTYLPPYLKAGCDLVIVIYEIVIIVTFRHPFPSPAVNNIPDHSFKGYVSD